MRINMKHKTSLITRIVTSMMLLAFTACASNTTAKSESPVATSKTTTTVAKTETPEAADQFKEKIRDSTVSLEAKKLIEAEADGKVLEEKLICTREKKTGSNFKVKICRTRAEVEALEEDASRSLQKIQRNKGTTGGN